MDGPVPLRQIYSEDLIVSVGLLFVAAGSCEAAVSLQAARCLAHPGVPMIQMHLSAVGMEMKLKLQTIEYCVQLYKKQDLAKIEKITGSIRRLFEHRNYIAHNLSVPRTAKRVETHVLKMTRRGPAANKTFTARQIEDFADLIHARARQLDQCLNEIGITRFPKHFEQVQ